MTLELASLPLAAAAGALGILSPCVWPLVPVVMSSAVGAGRAGPWLLATGLSLSFAMAGTLLTLLLVGTGLDPELFRYVAGALLVVLGLVLVWRRLGERVSAVLSRLSGRMGAPGAAAATGWGQFGVGALLGVVWLPCVGPTLGAAIGLASIGQSVGLAFVTMLAYGLGTGAVLLAAGIVSRRALARWRPRLLSRADRARRWLGGTLLVLGVLVLSGLDKQLEALAVSFVPDWAFAL